MSNGDAPYKHTRLADIKRKPLRDMASRNLHLEEETETDASLDTSFESVGKSPKSSAASPRARRRADVSPASKKRGLYPKLSPGKGDDEPDSSRIDDSLDSSYGGSQSDINQSAQKIRSPPKSQGRGRTKEKHRDERVRTNLYPALEPSAPAESSNMFSIIIVLGCILVLAMAVLLLQPSPEVVPDAPTASDIFLKDFKELKSSYPSQDAKFWKIIGTQVKRVLANDSSYPGVILFGTPEGYSSLGTCLAKQIISKINDAVKMSGDMYIDTASLDQTSDAKMKYHLDENLKTIFDYSKGAIIDHVEKLPAKAALLLHGYCDGDNAPYKDVVIFLMLHTDIVKGDLSDKVVEKSLMELWGSELGVDEMPALCSRIANNIVVLSPEQDETLGTCS